MDTNDYDCIKDLDRLLSQALKDHDCDYTELGKQYLNDIGQREALHAAHIMVNLIEQHLLSHAYVLLHDDVFALVHKAVYALHEAYQQIGRQTSHYGSGGLK